jgi:phytoene/squalene synthetase
LLCDRWRSDRSVFTKLHEVLAAADMDLARMTFNNLQELRAYCSRSGGALQELVASQLAAPTVLDEPARATANKLGVGIRLAEMLRDLRQDAYDGNIYPMSSSNISSNRSTCAHAKSSRSSKLRSRTCAS